MLKNSFAASIVFIPRTQNAKEVHSELADLDDMLKHYKVIASVAPSFISDFDVKGFEEFKKALLELGFYDAEETARGARIVVDEYSRLLESGKYRNFITSCCPAVNTMISLYYPDAIRYLAPVDSPVVAHGKVLKKEHPDCRVIFIGPCIAKKKECESTVVIDGVLTFEDIYEALKKKNIEFKKEADDKKDWNRARVFPVSRGIIRSFREEIAGYEYIAVDGVKRCQDVLGEIDRLENVFLELNACQGGCVNGPCSNTIEESAIISGSKVMRFMENNRGDESDEKTSADIVHKHQVLSMDETEPTEEQVFEVLKMTGKKGKEDELDCGACGYSSCRQKAWAVINGYADIQMCLPYMRERAESMSYEIIQKSPNGIAVIDENFMITDIIGKARDILGIDSFAEKEHHFLDCLDDTETVVSAAVEKRNIHGKVIKIPKTDTYVEISANYMKDHDMMFVVMKDITEEVNYNEKLDKVKADMIKATDAVIKKQMRTAQEIASLLGETTAEAKVALIRLKECLEGEED